MVFVGILNQVRSIDRQRLIRRLGKASDETMSAIDRAIQKRTSKVISKIKNTLQLGRWAVETAATRTKSSNLD